MKVEKLKKLININLEKYQSKGKKFFLFNKPPERADVIQELVKNIRALTDKQSIFHSDYLEIARQIIAVREKVITSHKYNSVWGSWGVTSSRLAKSLNKCLNDVVSNGILSQSDISSLEYKNEQNRILKI